MRLTIVVGNVNVLDRTLARFSHRVQDLSPAFEQLADQFARDERLQFDTEGGALGGRWAPLSPKYRQWKGRHYPGRPILVRTGALRRDLTERPLGIEEIRTHRVTLGTTIPYAGFHQSGGANLPRRPPVAVTEATKRQMVKLLQRYILGKA